MPIDTQAELIRLRGMVEGLQTDVALLQEENAALVGIVRRLVRGDDQYAIEGTREFEHIDYRYPEES